MKILNDNTNWSKSLGADNSKKQSARFMLAWYIKYN